MVEYYELAKQHLCIVVQPHVTRRNIEIAIDINRNLTRGKLIWLYYDREAEEINEERLAELDGPHAAVLRDFMQQTASLDAIEQTNGVRFRDSRVSLSIGRAYSPCTFADQISDVISQALDPQHELGEPEVTLDTSLYTSDIIVPDLDELLCNFVELICDNADNNDAPDVPDEPSGIADSASDNSDENSRDV